MIQISHSKDGSTLLLTLGCVAGLAIAAALTLQQVSPRFEMASQAVAWQEAHLAAEAGIDVGLVELEQNELGFNEGPWSGWSQYSQTMAPPTVDASLQVVKAALPRGLGLWKNGRVLPYGQAKKLGAMVPATSQVLGLANSLLSLIGNPVKVSAPIFLNNIQAASPGNRPTNVDLQLWAVYPTPSPYSRWYRLRSISTVALPPLARRSYRKAENDFRRYNLREVRPQLVDDEMVAPTNVPTPNAARVIEALVEPILPFELAILSNGPLSLGTSGSWSVDSYDSSDAAKSAPGGLYPGKASPLVQSNGNIGTNAVRPVSAIYGPLISANGSLVRGGLATNGGDDPSTSVHENVSGAMNIDPTRVEDDFYRQLRPLNRPSGGIILPPPGAGQPFVAGSVSQPNRYLISHDLHNFHVSAPAPGQAGLAIIMVNGDLSVSSGGISIDPNVQVQLFVGGNVDFYDRLINSGGQPAQLQIYGEDSTGEARRLQAFGNASITAAFYGPQYDISLQDNVQWFGAAAGKSFQMLGGGTGGFHYDESLSLVGAPIGFRIARYVEDVRE